MLRGHNDDIRAMAITPDSRRLATGDWYGRIRIWDLGASGPAASVREWYADDSAIISMTVTEDGQWLVTGHLNGVVRR